ncbi:hypothetical protein CANARDRAFT_5768 [[Candida] arabinofermentans NRRL YB-2248]|uniref:Thiamine phosphate synthase/TenI domain-containing protein n=1 Tax=[Candida] arabinofermentans NRRL YB-2248 TaxID=983967 RepID=A0A1E4T657_9ASCO|nr:hypothetical protein CANARDRAFT_5768 [[Candida] arabinofermentans NRRL YB-2248]
MERHDFDLSIYLVTNAEMVPESNTFIEQVKAAIDNGVTCVQLREKNVSTRAFIERALEVKKLTDAARIPLIINDRVDVALAVDAHLHIGQDDMTVPMARKLLGPNKIIGVSTGYVDEVEKAIDDGADYIGIGIIFDTNTKKTSKIAMGPVGCQELLKVIQRRDSKMKTCVIGGIKPDNVQRVRYMSSIPATKDQRGVSIDGAAVVSCIMAEKDAGAATRLLVKKWKSKPDFIDEENRPHDEKFRMEPYLTALKDSQIMVHHITNDVVKNFSANVTLAIGASPLMSECQDEFLELAANDGTALLLNTGTPNDEQTEMYVAGLNAYNKYKRPIVYDPVAAGASSIRRQSVKKILLEGYVSVIKGNAGEIYAAAGRSNKMRGVDSGIGESYTEQIEVAKELAARTKAVVVLTGKVDIIVDGRSPYDYTYGTHQMRVATVAGGHKMMSQITGTGCSLGSTIASFIAPAPATHRDTFLQTVAACCLYKKAGERAAALFDGKPGSFQTHFLDELSCCLRESDSCTPNFMYE